MALVSLKNTYPDYRNTFSDNNLSHLDDYSVYAQGEEKVGSVEDGLFDDTTGQFRYLIVDTGLWIFGKKVLLPIGKAQFDNENQRVYVHGLTKEQVEHLPEYDGQDVDYDYEERVRGVYRENAVAESAPVAGTTAYTRDSYRYDYDADLYTAPDENRNQPIRLYEERLIADKNRVKAGNVTVGKRVETETAEVSVPVEKDRVIIERATPTTTAAAAGHVFEDGKEVARVDVYEEKAAIRKEAFVREEVNLRKESEEEIVSEEATLRREKLDIETSDDVELINR
ncbi:MAG: DUF2382 domain-containing protein [Cyanobacteria bacterium J06621_11]